MRDFVRAIRQPSLVRRVVLALLVAFTLVWVALVMVDFWDFRGAIENR